VAFRGGDRKEWEERGREQERDSKEGGGEEMLTLMRSYCQPA